MSPVMGEPQVIWPDGRGRLETYLDQVDVLVVELDWEGRIRMMNAEGRRLLGVKGEDLVGGSWFDRFLAEPERPAARRQFASIVERGDQGLETRLMVIDGAGQTLALRIRASAVIDDDGRVLGVIYSGKDETELNRTALALGRSTKQLEDIQFALDVSSIVAITDRVGTITYVNDRFCAISKYEREELIGQNHRLINSGFHTPEFFKAMWSTIVRGEVWRGDLRNRAKDGSIYWVATTIVPFLDDQRRPYQFLAIRNEITQRKEAEEALAQSVLQLEAMTQKERGRAKDLALAHRDLLDSNRRLVEEQAKLLQAEKLSSIGLLASGVAHEINNPLSGVLGCIKSLRRDHLSDDRREEYFETVREGLERIQQTVKGLLDFARQRPPALESIDAGDLVASSLRLVAPAIRKKDLTIDNGLATAPRRILADRAQMMQALVNLLLNAVYATPEHSTLIIEPRAGGDGRLGISIRDQGPGIPKEIIKKVCDPFFTTKPEGEGTGLGLAVTLSIARANGGELSIESPPTGGTAVTLWIPVDEGALHA